MITPHHVVALVFGALAAFSVPGPCSYNPHPELDCDEGQRCPEGLACAVDGHCKPEDVACDDLDEEQFPGGGVACDGVCVGSATFLTDENNCGECGTVCDAGLGCCNGECVAIDNEERCGDCAIQCLATQTCFEAACRDACVVSEDCAGFLDGDVCCDGLCSDGNVDERCGACNIACDVSANETCVDQVCRTSCTNDADCPGSRCCDGLCTDPGDPEHCLGCNESCGADTICIDDECAPECADDRPCSGADEGLTCCEGRCVDVTDDDDHCGACGEPCPGSAFCHESECRSGTDRDCCGQACTDCRGQSRACQGGQCVRCDFLAQDCGTTTAGDTATCVPAFGLTAPDGICINALPPPAPGRNEQCTATTGNADCLAGFDCNQINADIDVCIAFCDPFSGGPQCLSDERCAQVEVAPGVFIGICVPICDLAFDTCTHGDLTGTCTPAGFGSCTGLAGVCTPRGPVVEGGSCAQFADCAEGLTCDQTDFTCRRQCRNTDTPCAGGGTCTNVFSCTEIGTCR